MRNKIRKSGCAFSSPIEPPSSRHETAAPDLLRILFVPVLLVCGCVPAWSQGQLVFDNRVNNVVIAPVYGIDPGDATVTRRGNTATGLPAGGETYPGPLLSGTGFTAQLFGGPLQAAAPNLQAISPAVSFRVGGGAGFVIPATSTVTVPGVLGGQPGKIQLRAWDNRDGTITNWAQVESDWTIPRGESWPFITPPLGGPFHAPPNLIGLESFNLATGALSGFRFKCNFQPDGAPVPLGYLADTGLPFGDRGIDLRFGWNFDHRPYAFDREATNAADQRHDTFIEMQTNSVWEIGLSNGLYAVHIALGDALRTNGTCRVEAGDILVVQAAFTPNRHWVEIDALIEITNGRLTLRSAVGAENNPLCFVEIARVDPPRIEAPARVGADGGFPIRFQGEPGFAYRVESSTNLSDWSQSGLAQLVRGMQFQFSATASTNAAHQAFRTRTLLIP